MGDRILSIDGERIYTFSDVSLLLGRNKTGDFDLVIRRDGQKLRLENFHMERGEYLDQSGQKFTGFGLYFGAQELTFGGRLRYCWDQAVDFVRLVRLSLQMLITGEAGFSDMSGPVGIVSTITTVGEQSENARAAAANIAYLAALIAVNLAVMNLLPLPALDGGKIFFLVVNALSLRIIRKQIPARFENYVHLAGFVLLMGSCWSSPSTTSSSCFNSGGPSRNGAGVFAGPISPPRAAHFTRKEDINHEQADSCGRRGRGRRRAGQHPIHVQYPHPGRGAYRLPDPPPGGGRVPDHPGGGAGYGRRPGHRPIRRRIHIPLVADIHFDYRLALECVRQGVDKIRINPGNIGSAERSVPWPTPAGTGASPSASASTAAPWSGSCCKNTAASPPRPWWTAPWATSAC